MIFDVFGVAYDETQTFRKGAGKFPELFWKHLSKAETYHQGVELSEKAFFNNLGIVKPGNFQELIDKVHARLSRISNFPLILGGEHTVTFASFKALKEKLNIQKFVCFDAHPDCEVLQNHASVVRRISALIGEENVYLFGVREMSKSEARFLSESEITIVKNPEDLGKISGNVYLSVDFDVFDPAILPSVGNPVANGVSFREALKGIRAVAGKVVAADFVEFTPFGNSLDEVYVHLAVNFILKTVAEIIKAKT